MGRNVFKTPLKVITFICLVTGSYVVINSQSPFDWDNPCELTQLKGPLNWDEPIVIKSLIKKYLYPPSDLAINLTGSDDQMYHIHKGMFSWDFFNHYNRHFFDKQKAGFFIEAGALDGEFMSNSLWLEQELGWSGLLIEADPVNFQHLTWKRRKAWTSNTCISQYVYPRQTVFESLQQNSIEFAIPWVYRANSREFNSYFSKTKGGFSQFSNPFYYNVQCFPLPSYLLALNVTQVDYLSLDIQGNEWDVIKTLPLKNILFRVLAIEHFFEKENGTSVIDQDFIRYMEDIQYKLIDTDDGMNYIFVLKNDTILEKDIQRFHKKNEKNKQAIIV